MSRLRFDLERVRGTGIAELRGFATYSIAPWASVRTTVMEPVLFDMIEIPAADATAWRVLGIATIVNGARVMQVSASDLLHDRTGLGLGGNCRIFMQQPGGTRRGGVPIALGTAVELLVEKADGDRDTPRIFNAKLWGRPLLGGNPNWNAPIRSSTAIGHAGLIGKRTLVDLGGTVWRFVENERGEMSSIEETLMPDVEAELVHKSHVDDFTLHYAHRPGAPLHFVSLHVWNGWRESYGCYSGPRLGAAVCPVLYGIDERSDRLVLEIGRTCLDHKLHNLEVDGPPFFHARFNLDGLSTPWWWEDAQRARDTGT